MLIDGGVGGGLERVENHGNVGGMAGGRFFAFSCGLFFARMAVL